LHRLAVGGEHAAREIGLQPAQGFARENIEPDGDRRPCARIEQLVRLGRTDQLVARIFSCPANGGDLHVFRKRIVELPITRTDFVFDSLDAQPSFAAHSLRIRRAKASTFTAETRSSQ
jgi:hypothetical protein